MLSLLQRPRYGHCHLLLLWAKLKILRTRQNAIGRKYFFDLLDHIWRDARML
jgi:hypothetical protein